MTMVRSGRLCDSGRLAVVSNSCTSLCKQIYIYIYPPKYLKVVCILNSIKPWMFTVSGVMYL